MPDIKAAVLHAVDSPLVIEQLTLQGPGPDEVLVRMVSAGVCHSDLHVIKGDLKQRMPIVLGHEGAGIVEAVGEDVTSVKPGMPVVLVWIPQCGHCFYCLNEQAHLCENGDPLANNIHLTLNGQPVRHFLSTAAFAEYVVVPQSGVLALIEDIPLEQAALVSCSVATGVGAVLNAARVPPGASVAVFGCGGVGLNVLQGARLADAGQIIAIDRVPAKLVLAEQFGATDTLDVSDADVNVMDAVREMTSGQGVDYAFEVVGDTQVLRQAYGATRKGGTVVMVGLPPMGQRLELSAISLVLQEKSLVGTFYGSMSPREHIPRLLAYYNEGRLMLEELLSHRYALDDINEAFAALEGGHVARGVIAFEG